MNKPILIDYGLDDNRVSVIKSKETAIQKIKACIGYSLFFLIYAIVIIFMWPYLGMGSFLAIIPAFIIWGILAAILNSLTSDYFKKKIISFPGYISLCKYESDLIEYKQEIERIKYEEKRVKAREEIEMKRQSWEFWNSLSPSGFEHEVADLFRANGYHANVTPHSNDGGVDIILTKEQTTTLVQCKLYKSKLGPAAIRELYGVMINRKVKNGIVVCPAGFTEGAWKFARKSNIRLVGLKRLIEMNEEIERNN